jgi:hypothetical protein
VFVSFRSCLAVQYQIEIHTGNEQDKALDAAVYMQIFGNVGNTIKLYLEPAMKTFAKNSIERFTVTNNYVGKVE